MRCADGLYCVNTSVSRVRLDRVPRRRVFASLISRSALRVPSTRWSQMALRARQVSPKQWRPWFKLDLPGEAEHLEHPESVPGGTRST